MEFYKYPECEPIKTRYYLCSLRHENGHFNKFEEILYVKGRGFIEEPAGLEVVAFTSLTAEEAFKNAQI